MSWQLKRDPARPTWPGVLVTDGEVIIPVVAGAPYNFSDSEKLARRIAAGLGGFTQEDMETLRQIAPFVVGSSMAFGRIKDWAHGLADRIEALLPPEGK